VTWAFELLTQTPPLTLSCQLQRQGRSKRLSWRCSPRWPSPRGGRLASFCCHRRLFRRQLVASGQLEHTCALPPPPSLVWMSTAASRAVASRVAGVSVCWLPSKLCVVFRRRRCPLPRTKNAAGFPLAVARSPPQRAHATTATAAADAGPAPGKSTRCEPPRRPRADCREGCTSRRTTHSVQARTAAAGKDGGRRGRTLQAA